MLTIENLSTQHFKISLTNCKDKSRGEKGNGWLWNWKFTDIYGFFL